MAKNGKLKAYVRYDGTGRIIPGSLILNRFKPAVGKWEETPAYECCNPVVLPALRLMFVDISFANGLVGDATNVNDWNTYLNLPVNGTPFTSVTVTGNEVSLIGGSGITLKALALGVLGKDDPPYLISVDDEAGVIIELKEGVFYKQSLLTMVSLPQLITTDVTCFTQCTSLNMISLPLLQTAGDACFIYCTSLTMIFLPLCTNLGSSVDFNNVFLGIVGNTISLTIPVALMTCNGGLPDGDIQYLQANNTVTIITT